MRFGGPAAAGDSKLSSETTWVGDGDEVNEGSTEVRKLPNEVPRRLACWGTQLLPGS